MNLRTCQILALSVVLTLGGAARAQLRLPSLGSTLSPITRAPALQRLDPLVDNVLAPVDLATARLDAATQLARAHRREVDRDPQGELIVRAEVLAQPSSLAARDALLQAGFELLREDELDGLDDGLVVMKAPRRLALADAVARARAIDPAGAYDFHHIYLGSGSVPVLDGAGKANAPGGAAPPPFPAGLRVGLIDSGVDGGHPAFRHVDLVRHGCDDGEHPAAHGTAVASLMVGADDAFNSALPGAALYAGDGAGRAAPGLSAASAAGTLPLPR